MSSHEPRPTGPAPPGEEREKESAGEILRQRAESIVRAQGVRSREEIENLSVGETRRIIHELCVHHIELEMQNEELLRVQAELDAERARYFDLYDRAPLGYCTVDERGLIVEINAAAASLLGVAQSALVGRPIAASILRADGDVFYLLRRQLSKSGEPQTVELRMAREDGTPVWVQIAATLGRTALGASELRCMITDISERKSDEEAVRRSEEDLRVSRLQLASASQAKLNVLVGMSAEIRKPIQVIGGLSQLVRGAGATPEQEGWLTKIDRAAEHLLLVFNQILDLAKIEAGQMPLDNVHFQVSRLLDSVASAISELARAKGLRVEKIDTGVPLWLRGDPTRLLQALLNYALNAVRFTHKGSIVLRARLLVDGGEDLLVRFSVEDTGEGIDPRLVGRLFGVPEPEAPPMDEAAKRQWNGLGLGLAITRQLAQLMGGEAGAESSPGKGSTFWFIARLERGVETARGPVVEALLRNGPDAAGRAFEA